METRTTAYERVLRRLWERHTGKTDGSEYAHEWNEQVYHLSLYGRSVEETTRYLFGMQPTFEMFVEWLEEMRPPEREYADDEDVLTAADMDFWHEHGYVVLKNAVSQQQCDAARAAIWEYLDASPYDAESWYRQHPGKNGMMLSFFHHPALDENRRSARIRKAFLQLYRNEEIYLLMDKVSFNPPETASFIFNGSLLHWDVSLQLPIPYVLQGLLYLNDVAEADGAFHCVPGFHRTIEDWLNKLPAGTDARSAALTQLSPIPIPGHAGDLVIWNQALPHCATPNKGEVPRLVQYIAYKPVHVAARGVWI